MLKSSRRLILMMGAAASLSAPALAQAQASDPAAIRVGAFYATLLETMKAGKSAGLAGRLQRLTPAVQQSFNLPIMAQFATGDAWTRMTPAERASVTAAFARYTVSSYAHNFDSFTGQKFVVDPAVQTRGPDKLVKTQIVSAGDSPVNLNYRMRQYGGAWKVIDIYYNNISQLTTQRSDFASTLKGGGASALVTKLDSLTMKLK